MRTGIREIKPMELVIIEHVAAELKLMPRTKTDKELSNSLFILAKDILTRDVLTCK